ncbi:hypothetical protein GQ55_1G178800 [Panicum hallii var. hallii]|uniref:Uncharacterized protein n=1 Tax=Panicum hallii var. hallii TaxID=1504633 RepID=A0A2T7F618_9POAL|nr:hypothetical protein GQ55_1G178800 [Panicum hallii var. hallii]
MWPLRPRPPAEPPSGWTGAGREAPARCSAHGPGRPVGALTAGRSKPPPARFDWGSRGRSAWREWGSGLETPDGMGAGRRSRSKIRLLRVAEVRGGPHSVLNRRILEEAAPFPVPPNRGFRANELRRLLHIAPWMALRNGRR